jgi:hypothetical protein
VTALPSHVVLLDSITQVDAHHAGLCVVTGSHGGVSAARYASAVAARVYVFNDAGVGKDAAGIAALALLDARAIAAVAVAHDSARIGEARDTWNCGVISHRNATAGRMGVQPGARLSEVLVALPGVAPNDG